MLMQNNTLSFMTMVFGPAFAHLGYSTGYLLPPTGKDKKYAYKLCKEVLYLNHFFAINPNSHTKTFTNVSMFLNG